MSKSNTQQNFNAGQEACAQGQAKAEEWVQSTKNTADAARNKTANAAQSASDSCQQIRDSAQHDSDQSTGFFHQTGEQVMNMAQGAVDTMKNTLGVGDKK
jgi:hypothetical protein